MSPHLVEAGAIVAITRLVCVGSTLIFSMAALIGQMIMEALR